MVQFDVSSYVLKDNLEKPISVTRIKFDQILRTQYDALTAEVNSLFGVQNVGQLLKHGSEAAKRMERDGLFNNVQVRCSVASDTGTDDQKAPGVPVEVNFVVDEPNFIRGNVNAGVTNRGESQLGAEFSLASIFGRGERFTAQSEIGHQKSSLFNVSFLKPLLGGRETKAGIHLSRHAYEWPWNSLAATETGIAVDLAHSTFGDRLHHIIRVQSDWRNLGCMSKATPFYVRAQAGHTLKNSIKNILSFSTEDGKVLAKKGNYIQLMQDFAGPLGGDVDLLKHEIMYRFSTPLVRDIFASFSVQGKHVMSLNSGRMALIDRVYLGGQADLRGFSYCGIGPTSDGAFVGGMGSWAAAAHLYKPLIPARYFFAHAFAAAGNVCSFSANKTFSDLLTELSKEPRVTLGLGIAVNLGNIARLEVNYCWPISSHPGDMKQPGFQFGAGISFL